MLQATSHFPAKMLSSHYKCPHHHPTWSSNTRWPALVLIILLSSSIPTTFSHQIRPNYELRLQKRQALQRFSMEPDNMTVSIGQSVMLPCRVSNKAGTLQWTRDGFGLGTDPRLEGFPTYSMIQNDATGDYSLKISSVTLDDDATFQCQIGALDYVPGIRSQSARLTVQVAPDDPVIVHGDFVNAPTSLQNHQVLSTTAGTNIELICEAHGGRPAAELTWYNGRNRAVKKGTTSTITPMNDGKRFNSALKWTFEPTKADHNKKVTCRSTHPTMVNYSAASIQLEVKYSPDVKVEVSRIKATSTQNSLNAIGSNLHGRTGDSLRIKCLADGNPGKEALVYQWLRGDEVIAGDYRDELILSDIDKSWNGAEIKCKVSNTVGIGAASVTLNIAYGPSFLPIMDLVYGTTSGDNVRLSCNVDANPSPEITWIKVGSSSVMSTGAKLNIRNVNQEHIGEYLCRASVKGFAEISAIVYLRLNGPPKIRKRHSHNYAVLGESGHLDCLVESVPAPIAITWIHNGQVFTSGSTNNIPTNVDIREQTLREEAVAIKTSFDIIATTQTDFGYYNCVVVNKHGSDWHVVSLQQQTSFATIVTITLISISVLVFIVLSTSICLLSIKHRKLVKNQHEANLKHHYMNSDDSDNHNIYSTASTRTNSSSEKTIVAETGTIITRSGSTGSPRSSTSSFPPYMDSNHSPAPSQSNFGLSHHHHNLTQPHSLHSNFAESAHSQFFSPFNVPPNSANLNPTMPTYPRPPSMSNEAFAAPLSNNYSSLSRPITAGLSSPFSLVHLYPYSQQGQHMYQASPYQVISSGRSTVKSAHMPTPPPSLTKELDSCVSKASIATHV